MTTDDLKFFAGLSVVTIIVISLLVYLGLKLNKALGKHAAAIHFPLHISLTGNILSACLVASWVYCAAIRALKPESPLGVVLQTPDGIATVAIGSILVFAIVSAVLERFGYPSFTKGDEP